MGGKIGIMCVTLVLFSVISLKNDYSFDVSTQKTQKTQTQGYRLGIARLLVSCAGSHHACSLTNYPLTHAHAHFCIISPSF